MTIPQPKIGLLPLFLKLYDDNMPEVRPGCAAVLQAARDGLTRQGAELVVADVCRVAAEVEAAVTKLEAAGVDCLATLHLTYSPSLEAAPALTRSNLPLIVLDTTIDASFGPDTDPARIMFNHGVHGVMDLASVLRRQGRGFEIVAGQVNDARFLERAVSFARAARAARAFRGMQAARFGGEFVGMGDFAVTPAVLRDTFNIGAQYLDVDVLTKELKAVSSKAIDTEIARDRERYDVRADAAVHRRSVHTGLALRRYLDAHGYGACSANFESFRDPTGPVMPFLELSKGMARGIGYGGEGDLLTASLVGALARGFGRTTFTEVFCSDWQGNSLFLAHMGELNPEVMADKPLLIVKDYPFIKAGPAAAIVGGIRPGPAVYVNIVPGPRDSFHLIVAPVEMLADTKRQDLQQWVRGWMRPAQRPVAEFLEEYSRQGGTHHSALVLGDLTEAIAAFGRFVGVPVSVL